MFRGDNSCGTWEMIYKQTISHTSLAMRTWAAVSTFHFCFDFETQQMPLSVAPWTHRTTQCDVSYTKYNQNTVPRVVTLEEYHEIKHACNTGVALLTDTTKWSAAVGCSAVESSGTQEMKTDCGASALIGQVHGFSIVASSVKEGNLTDSQGALKVLISNEGTQKVFWFSDYLTVYLWPKPYGSKLVFHWVSSHTGSLGNGQVDQAAWTCCTGTVDIHNVSFTDLKAAVKACVKTNSRTNITVKRIVNFSSSNHFEEKHSTWKR